MAHTETVAITAARALVGAWPRCAARAVGICGWALLAACSMTEGEPKARPANNLPPVAVQEIASLGALAPRHAAPPEQGAAQISSDIPHIVVIRNRGGAIVGTWSAGTGQGGPLVVACFEALQRLRGRERLKKGFPDVCRNVPIREIQAG